MTDDNWSHLIALEKEKDYFKQLSLFIEQREKAGFIVYPSVEQRFQAFDLTSFSSTKVVIIGQDPYHGAGQAHGLAFSVKQGIKIPPSLRNIYKELHRSIPNFIIPDHGFLVSWAKQGVLMINRVLTVEQGSANSHQKKGWETFSYNMIKSLVEHRKGIIFLLWGNPAAKLEKEIDLSNHYILKSAHPSPLSAHRGFLGCDHFVEVNKILKADGKKEIDWQPPLSELPF